MSSASEAILGLVAMHRGIVRALALEAAPTGDAPLVPPDDPRVLAMLGVLRFLSHIDDAVHEHLPPALDEQSFVSPRLEGKLLR